jgi:prepilin-type N-terminal cleavage/methylation domain-containing protein/prepilin-type processing-associated H-X9-DG protein
VRATDRSHPGFTLLELLISIALVAILLGVLLPLLSSARETSQRERCRDNLRRIGRAVELYLEDHDGCFPVLAVESSWGYAGMRFSPVDGHAFPDARRPLTSYLPPSAGPRDGEHVLCCPADRNILRADGTRVMREPTVFRTLGTSYRANGELFRGHLDEDGVPVSWCTGDMVIAPSRMVVMGDPIWFELRERTGYEAAWHGDDDRGNLLFLDGSVKYMPIRPKSRPGPAVWAPRAAD